MKILKILQISFIISFATAVGAFSVWRYYHGHVWWLIVIVSLIGFVALLSGYFWGSRDAWQNKVIKLIFEIGLSSITRALISNFIVIVVTIMLIYFAINAKPDISEYYEVRVFNGVDVPINYQVGAKVTLHTRTDGITHQETIGKDGGAVFWKITHPTNYIFQIDVENTDSPFTTGGSDIITDLPGLLKIDLSKIPVENRQSILNIRPEKIINIENRTSEYLTNVDERGDIDLQKSNAPWGVPHARLIINRLGYVLGYNYERKMLSWVAYSVFPNQQDIRRPDRFIPDPAIPLNAQASIYDYQGSGYDRGHMISPSDLFFKGRVVVEECFYFSTITPQSPNLNRGLWSKLEIRVREVVKNNQQPVYIIAGPLFIKPEDDPMFNFKTIGDGNIPVPTHFFRIVAKQVGNEIDAFALIVPNLNIRDNKLEKYLVSISEVEQKSGLVFFPLLKTEVAKGLKNKVQNIW